jgi:hypothetical protein
MALWLSGLLGDLQLCCVDLSKLCGVFVAISWGPPIKLWRSSQALWCLDGDFLSLWLSLWRLPQALYGFGDRPQVSHSDRFFHLGGRAREDYGEPSWCLESLVPPHRSNGDYQMQGCELRDTSSSPHASVISIPELLYLCNLLCDSHQAWSLIYLAIT